MKKNMLRITITVIILFILCTFLSKTIANSLLPVVETTTYEFAELSNVLDLEGRAIYLEKEKIRVDFSLKVVDVFVKEGETVRVGDPILQVDIKEPELKKEQMELSLLQLTNMRSQWGLSKNTQNELDMEIGILQSQIEWHKTSYPEDGCVYSSVFGVVKNLYVEEGEYTSSVVAEIVDKRQTLFVLVQLTEENTVSYPENCPVTYTFSKNVFEEGKNKTIVLQKSSNVEKVVRDIKTNDFLYYIPVTSSEGIEEGKAIQVQLRQVLGRFEKVLPLSAVSVVPGGDSRALFIYVVRTREGLFGEEKYVEAVAVEELAKTGSKIAVYNIELMQDWEIVVFSDRVLEKGQTVKVME